MQTLQKYNKILLEILNCIEQRKEIDYSMVYKIPSSECHKLIIEMIQHISNQLPEYYAKSLLNTEIDNVTN